MIASTENYHCIVRLKNHDFHIPTPRHVPELWRAGLLPSPGMGSDNGICSFFNFFFCFWSPSLAGSWVIWKEKWNSVLPWSVIKGTWSIIKEGKKWQWQSCHRGIIEPIRLEKPFRAIESNCKPSSPKATVKLSPHRCPQDVPKRRLGIGKWGKNRIVHTREEQIWSQGRNCRLGIDVVSVSLNVIPGGCWGAAPFMCAQGLWPGLCWQLGQAGEGGSVEYFDEGFLKLLMEETAWIYVSFCESSSNVGAGGFPGLGGWIEGAETWHLGRRRSLEKRKILV